MRHHANACVRPFGHEHALALARPRRRARRASGREIDHHNIRIGRHDARAAAPSIVRGNGARCRDLRRAGPCGGRAHSSTAAARIPDCRIAPPNSLRAVQRVRCRRRVPASAAPTGAPRPLENATITVSARSANSASGTPVATLAFQRRAPSMCTRKPALRPRPPGSPRAPSIVVICRRRRCACSRRTPDWPPGSSETPDAAWRGDRGGHHEIHRSDGSTWAPFSTAVAGDLAVDDVRVDVGEHFRATRRMDPDRGLIGHHAAREKQRRLFPKQRGDPFLESPHRRIAIPLVVTDLGRGHRGPHRRRRLGDRVAS